MNSRMRPFVKLVCERCTARHVKDESWLGQAAALVDWCVPVPSCQHSTVHQRNPTQPVSFMLFVSASVLCCDSV